MHEIIFKTRILVIAVAIFTTYHPRFIKMLKYEPIFKNYHIFYFLVTYVWHQDRKWRSDSDRVWTMNKRADEWSNVFSLILSDTSITQIKLEELSYVAMLWEIRKNLIPVASAEESFRVRALYFSRAFFLKRPDSFTGCPCHSVISRSQSSHLIFWLYRRRRCFHILDRLTAPTDRVCLVFLNDGE